MSTHALLEQGNWSAAITAWAAPLDQLARVTEDIRSLATTYGAPLHNLRVGKPYTQYPPAPDVSFILSPADEGIERGIWIALGVNAEGKTIGSYPVAYNAARCEFLRDGQAPCTCDDGDGDCIQHDYDAEFCLGHHTYH